MKRQLAIALVATTAAALAAGCAPTTGGGPAVTEIARTGGTRIGGGVRIGGCPRVNIGTPSNPRFVNDPACSTGGR